MRYMGSALADSVYHDLIFFWCDGIYSKAPRGFGIIYAVRLVDQDPVRQDFHSPEFQ